MRTSYRVVVGEDCSFNETYKVWLESIPPFTRHAECSMRDGNALAMHTALWPKGVYASGDREHDSDSFNGLEVDTTPLVRCLRPRTHVLSRAVSRLFAALTVLSNGRKCGDYTCWIIWPSLQRYPFTVQASKPIDLMLFGSVMSGLQPALLPHVVVALASPSLVNDHWVPHTALHKMSQ
jgi:hypothetical protein